MAGLGRGDARPGSTRRSSSPAAAPGWSTRSPVCGRACWAMAAASRLTAAQSLHRCCSQQRAAGQRDLAGAARLRDWPTRAARTSRHPTSTPPGKRAAPPCRARLQRHLPHGRPGACRSTPTARATPWRPRPRRRSPPRPIGSALGLDGLARSVTGNYWMEDDQADTLATGDVSKFSQVVNWSALAAADATPEPQPTGYSARWYVSRLTPARDSATDDGNEGDFKPTLMERVQPYAVYVPTGYRTGHRGAADLDPALAGGQLQPVRRAGPAAPPAALSGPRLDLCHYGGLRSRGLVLQRGRDRLLAGVAPAGAELHAGPGAHGHLRVLDGRLGVLQAGVRAPRRLRRRARARRAGGVRCRGLPRGERPRLPETRPARRTGRARRWCPTRGGSRT